MHEVGMGSPRRACWAALLSLMVGCDDWPNQDLSDDNGIVAPPGPPPRQVGARCIGLSATNVGASTPSNGAYCFGVLAGLSDGLSCNADARETTCIDPLVGYAYAVRWSGTSGQVFDASRPSAIGTVSQRSTSSFEVLTATGEGGVCSYVGVGAARRAELCAYVE